MKCLSFALVLATGFGVHAATSEGDRSRTARSSAAAPASSPISSPIPIPDDIVDARGRIVPGAYESIAKDYTGPDAIRYRKGEASAVNDHPALSEVASIGTIRYDNGGKLDYQFGGPPRESDNDYVTNQGGGLVAAKSLLKSVVRLTTMTKDRGTINVVPQVFWQDGADPVPGQLREYLASGFLKADDWMVVMAHGVGPGDAGVTRQSIFITQATSDRPARGVTIGTATAPGKGSFTLKPNVAATSGCITDGGEFLFLTLWNWAELKGEIAVVALASIRPGYSLKSPWPLREWWNDWDRPMPGMFNQGNWQFMKVVGYVPLPDDVKAPTSCRALTGVTELDRAIAQGSDPGGVGELASPIASKRAMMLPGGKFYEKYAKGGLLVVGSYSEQKLAWIDLAPLIGHYNDTYFGSDAGNARTRDMGAAETQWPFVLAAGSPHLPRLIKTDDAGGHVRAIVATVSYGYWSKDDRRRKHGTPYWMNDPHEARVWPVTKEGTVSIYEVGRWVPGKKPPDRTPRAGEIRKIGEFKGLGKNIVGAASVKSYPIDLQGQTWSEDDGKPGSLDHMIAVADREGRQATWLQFSLLDGGRTAFVRHVLKDRDFDPMDLEMADAYDQQTGVTTFPDGTARAFKNYRILPFSYRGKTYPVPAGGQRSGAFRVDGIPLAYGMGNVP
ncbi:MAG: hypothetical protein KKC79_19470 [Gammaproteobacteria bacterium]|nr:hypothetical protein [Gammaproteobacteria bacterium]